MRIKSEEAPHESSPDEMTVKLEITVETSDMHEDSVHEDKHKAEDEEERRNIVTKSSDKPTKYRGPRKWTGAQLEALFTAALGPVSGACFQNAVPGRTQQQCYSTWRWAGARAR